MLNFLAPSIFTVNTEHVPGADNDGASALSCPSQLPTWSSAIIVSPELRPLMAY